MAVLGTCPEDGNFLTASPYIIVNEVSTVVAAYAMAGFATDAIHVSSFATGPVQTTIASGFANAASLESLSTGVALATTSQSEINTLGNILAACINSNGVVRGPQNPTACYTLFNGAMAAGVQPADTASAAINIARNPALNVQALFGLSTAAAPFQPSLSLQPNDFRLPLSLPAYHAYGDSITYGETLPHTSLAYPSLIAGDRKLTLSNYAIPGDQACDLPTHQIFPNSDNPVAGAFPLYTLLIGTNDVDERGAQDYLNVYNLCAQASIAWLALPADLKNPRDEYWCPYQRSRVDQYRK